MAATSYIIVELYSPFFANLQTEGDDQTTANLLVESFQDESMLFNSGSEDSENRIVLYTPIFQRTGNSSNPQPEEVGSSQLRKPPGWRRCPSVLYLSLTCPPFLTTHCTQFSPFLPQRRRARTGLQCQRLPPSYLQYPSSSPFYPPGPTVTPASRDLNTKIDSPGRYPEIWRVREPVLALPTLFTPAVDTCSVSLFCRWRNNGKSRDHPSGGYVVIAPVGNSSYARQTHKTGHSYDCYFKAIDSELPAKRHCLHQRPKAKSLTYTRTQHPLNSLSDSGQRLHNVSIDCVLSPLALCMRYKVQSAIKPALRLRTCSHPVCYSLQVV